MTKTFKYSKPDKRCKRLTLIWIISISLVVFAIGYFFGEGGFIPAWLVSLIVALVTLYILSIPRNIVVTETALEIRCIVEITRIRLPELRSIRRVEPDYMKGKYVFVGSYGFFGYYGYYVDSEKWETLLLYCTRLNNLVEITDVYEKRYIVNCEQADELIKAVTAATHLYSED